MIIHYATQGEYEWEAIRCGKVTASRFKDCIAKGKGSEPSKVRANYLYEIVSEIMTGQPSEQYTNAYMEHGTLTEPMARMYYEEKEQTPVEQVGFVEHSQFIGASPDGFASTNGLVEFKCPKTSTQIQRVLAGIFPPEYMPQVQGQMWVCEREWCDFVSYDPRIKGPACYFKTRVYRDDIYIKKLSEGVDKFIEEMLTILDRLRT